MGRKGQTEAADRWAQGQFFCGQYRHNLDPKSRLTIPAEWAAIVGQPAKLYVIPSVGRWKFLYVFPARVMEPKLQHIHNLSMADERGRAFLRMIGARSEAVAWDVQRRIRIRDELLAHAGLKDTVLMVGNVEAFELWAPERWTEFERSMTEEGLAEASRYVGV